MSVAIRILCVCRGDRCRGPMFAAMYRRHLEALNWQGVVVESAGCLKGTEGQPTISSWFKLDDEVDKQTLEDLKEHRARWIGRLDLREYHRIICLDSEVYEEVRRLDLSPNTDLRTVNIRDLVDNLRDGGIVDPAGRSTEEFRRTYKLIRSIVIRMPLFLRESAATFPASK